MQWREGVLHAMARASALPQVVHFRFGGARMAEIGTIGVVGAGTMGSGIAHVFARAGYHVHLCDVDERFLERALGVIRTNLVREAAKGKLPESEIETVMSRIAPTVDRAWLGEAEIVIEAASERFEIKAEIFRALDRILPKDAVLATNTSSISITKLAALTKRPEKVIGMHFFNPVPVLRLVEVISSLLTSAETTERVNAYASDSLNKRVIASKDRAGFVVNALLIPYLLSAIRMLESGFASAEDIDTGMVVGCAHPLGPLALTDLIGLDTTLAVAESLYEEFKEPHLAPPPLLSRMTQAGLLGRKSGQGFYAYK